MAWRGPHFRRLDIKYLIRNDRQKTARLTRDRRRPHALGGRHHPTQLHISRSRPGLYRKTPGAVECDYRVTYGTSGEVHLGRGFVVIRTGCCDPVPGGGDAARPTPRWMLPSVVGSAERCNFVNPHAGQATSWCLLPPHSGQTSYAITDSERNDTKPFPWPLWYDFSPVVGGPHLRRRAVPLRRQGVRTSIRSRTPWRASDVFGKRPMFAHSIAVRQALGDEINGSVS